MALDEAAETKPFDVDCRRSVSRHHHSGWTSRLIDCALIGRICITAGLAASVVAPATSWPEGAAPDRLLSDHAGVQVTFGG